MYKLVIFNYPRNITNYYLTKEEALCDVAKYFLQGKTILLEQEDEPDVETEHEYPVIEDSERRDEQCQKKNK